MSDEEYKRLQSANSVLEEKCLFLQSQLDLMKENNERLESCQVEIFTDLVKTKNELNEGKYKIATQIKRLDSEDNTDIESCKFSELIGILMMLVMEYEQHESDDMFENCSIMENEIKAKDLKICNLLNEIDRTKAENNNKSAAIQHFQKVWSIEVDIGVKLQSMIHNLKKEQKKFKKSLRKCKHKLTMKIKQCVHDENVIKSFKKYITEERRSVELITNKYEEANISIKNLTSETIVNIIFSYVIYTLIYGIFYFSDKNVCLQKRVKLMKKKFKETRPKINVIIKITSLRLQGYVNTHLCQENVKYIKTVVKLSYLSPSLYIYIYFKLQSISSLFNGFNSK